MKRLTIVINSVIVFLLCFVLLTLSGCTKQTEVTQSNYKSYVKDLHAECFMPDIDNLGKFESFDCTRIENDEMIVYSDCLDLTVKYNEKNYKRVTDWIEKGYSFITAPQTADYCKDGEYTIPVPEFSIDNYKFKVVQNSDFDYPKNFGIIGYSESTYEVSFLWFYDINLDLISNDDDNREKAMEDFVRNKFKWDKRHQAIV